MRPAAEAVLAEASYRDAARRMAATAIDHRDAGRPLNARIAKRYAYIALNAARAEVFDPETVVGPSCLCAECRRYVHARP